MGALDFLQITPKGNIGGIEIQATLEELYSDVLHTTQHPVEIGAPITDHAYKRPMEVVIKCGWSNSGIDALVSTVTSLFSGDLSMTDYVGGIYSQLLALQESRQPFDITTTKRIYSNMLIVALMSRVDEKTSNVLMVTATCREMLIVETQATTLPPKENQASPQETASAENAGVKKAVAATPSPGGSAPIGN